MVFAFAVSAACFLGVGFVLQQDAAQRAPMSDFLSLRLLLDLARMPRWLAGIALMVCGMALGAIALGRGEVSLVEPLLATNLLFAMAFSRWRTRAPLGLTGWGGLWLLAGGVAAFIVAGRPHGGRTVTDPLRHWLVVGVMVGAALLLAALSKRVRMSTEAALLAVAAGLLYGVQDALTRVCGSLLGQGWTVLATSWQPYAVAALGVTALVLVQSAFETAPLRMSLPALTAAQPLAGIACGVGFMGDQLRTTPGALAAQAAGVVAIVLGIVLIGRHPAMPSGTAAPGQVRDLQPH
ncbi:DMT family transporter [Streptomyces sp. NPDC021096]|uniref:DMT family transporter n=1 Tax=Streptomyces sp. NPDC021096 TaxID=3154792 RepID=UPI0033CAC619